MFDFLSKLERHYARQVADAMTTDDLWRMARRRVPRVVFEYFRGGADDEGTLRANVDDFRRAVTTAWGATKFDSLDMQTSAAGHEMKVPWYISPVGSLRALWTEADAIAAKVAGEHGTVMALSTLSGTPMETVSSASSGKCWFQLYLCGGREVALRGIERAKKAGYTGLVLTIDTGVAGNRAAHARMKPMLALESNVAKLKLAPQMLIHLPWLISHLADDGMMKFVNVQMDKQGTPMPYADIGKQLAASAVTWDDLTWIRQAWGDMPLIIKGVHIADDAKRAEDLGASAVIWSNHGGRQQDGVPSALQIVADEMPKMKDSKLDFLMDGGIRRGRDVVTALSYGLRAVGLGRVCVAGIGAGGYAGLDRAFRILHDEFSRSLRLIGVRSVEDIRQRGEEIRRKSRETNDGHFVF